MKGRNIDCIFILWRRLDYALCVGNDLAAQSFCSLPASFSSESLVPKGCQWSMTMQYTTCMPDAVSSPTWSWLSGTVKPLRHWGLSQEEEPCCAK